MSSRTSVVVPTFSAVAYSARVARGLRVNTARMRANIEITGGLALEVGAAMVARKRECALRVQPEAVRVLNLHHGFDVLARSGRTHAQVIDELAATAARWMCDHLA